MKYLLNIWLLAAKQYGTSKIKGKTKQTGQKNFIRLASRKD